MSVCPIPLQEEFLHGMEQAPILSTLLKPLLLDLREPPEQTALLGQRDLLDLLAPRVPRDLLDLREQTVLMEQQGLLVQRVLQDRLEQLAPRVLRDLLEALALLAQQVRQDLLVRQVLLVLQD